MEDILEEIVGEIYDEYDIEEFRYKKIDNSTFLFDGETPIYEVEKVLGIELPEGDYDTISGYLLFELNRIPNNKEKGIVIEKEKLRFKIEQITGNRIKKVKVIKKDFSF